ncbi:MAG: adenylate/guanylate cyclase domain-containing protein [Ferruginibacter sp.]
MGRINLKNIIGKNKPFHEVILQWIAMSGAEAWVESPDGKILLGTARENYGDAYPVNIEDEMVCLVKGNEKALLVADLIRQLALKELEKKNLGTEVLNLYQEINVIFDFTASLTETIDIETIACLTLEKAIHSIDSDSGIIILWDDNLKSITVPSHAGSALFNMDRIKQHADLLLSIALSGQSEILHDISALKQQQVIAEQTGSVMFAAMKVKNRIMGAVVLAADEPDHFSAANLKLLVTLALQSSAAIESASLYEKNLREAHIREEAMLRIQEVTAKFVPHEFIHALGKGIITDVKLGDQVEKIVTVLFTDIRDFTSLSEEMTPEENFRFVSAFNSQLGPIIRANNGFINQYLGDSIMAIFPGDPADAIKAAILMQQSIRALNLQREIKKLPLINTGIGMHTGPLIMGITGDEQRMDAATISDTVNTASRIESLTKYFRASLLLSKETVDNIKADHFFQLRNLGSVRLKGKNKSLEIIECFDGSEKSIFQKMSATVHLFTRAMELFEAREFEKAVIIFQSILSINPEDLTANHFMERARRHQRDGVSENWSSTEEMMSK